jgi:hypothetical protein
MPGLSLATIASVALLGAITKYGYCQLLKFQDKGSDKVTLDVRGSKISQPEISLPFWRGVKKVDLMIRSGGIGNILSPSLALGRPIISYGGSTKGFSIGFEGTREQVAKKIGLIQFRPNSNSKVTIFVEGENKTTFVNLVKNNFHL